MTIENRRAVILDTDPGLDDAVALFFLLGRADILDLIGITTVYGNTTLEHTTENALKLLSFLNRDIPVYPGAEAPLIREHVSGEMIHGPSGLADVDLPEPTKGVAEDGVPAAQFMAREVLKRPGEVTIMTIGPMTNLALALRLYPGLSGKIAQVITMGGAMGMGNRTPSAEYNIFADPHAAHIVFSSGVPLVMLGLDVTEQSYPGPEERRFLEGLNHPVGELTRQFMDYFRKVWTSDRDMALHDACAVCYAVKPDVFRTTKMDVKVELTGTHTLGRTVCSKGEEEEPDQESLARSAVQVATEIDRKAFLEEFKQAYERLAKA